MIEKQIQDFRSKIASKIDDNGDGKVEIRDLTNKSTKFAGEVWEKVTGYLLAAFGLVAGLAWNDAIKAFIGHYYPMTSDGLAAQLIYAVLVTILVVVVTIIFMKLARKSEDKQNK